MDFLVNISDGKTAFGKGESDFLLDAEGFR